MVGGMADRSVEITLSSERKPVDALTEAFAAAERSIDAAVYKFSLRTVFVALEEALDRGVAVRLVVDKRLIDCETAGFAGRLAKKKGRVTVRKWPGDKLHAKLVIIDDRQVLSGSYNWSKSAEKNTELLLCFDDSPSVGRFASLFEDLWKDAEEL
jgi:phosphatidylserine/phosphatidylglycerophosphate/cardiolipin synthase-like enzyme